MALLNYTTQIEAIKTVGEIQVINISAGQVLPGGKFKIPFVMASIMAIAPKTEVVLLRTDKTAATENLPGINMTVGECDRLIAQGDKCLIKLPSRHPPRQSKGGMLLVMAYPEPD
ncbi:unnamed protein product, partial [marine sediment metagenome]